VKRRTFLSFLGLGAAPIAAKLPVLEPVAETIWHLDPIDSPFISGAASYTQVFLPTEYDDAFWGDSAVWTEERQRQMRAKTKAMRDYLDRSKP
jgi:hypothetical protein